DELATFQVIELHSVPSQGRIAEYRIGNGQSGGVGGIRNSRRLGTPRPSFKSFPHHMAASCSISTRRQQAAVAGGQTEMGPRSMGMGGVTTGAQFAERIELGLFTLRRWEMFFASPTSPSGRYRLVALTPSRDLFVHAKDLFVEANDREP